MNYNGNVSDWHQYNIQSSNVPEVTPSHPNVNPGHYGFVPNVNQSSINSFNHNSNTLEKHQNLSHSNPRHFQSANDVTTRYNGSGKTLHAPASQMPNYIGHYNLQNPRYPVDKTFYGAGGEARTSSFPYFAEERYRNAQIPITNSIAHSNRSKLNINNPSGTINQQRGIPTSTVRQNSSINPCKGICCNTDSHNVNHHWDKTGTYPANSYRDAIPTTGYQVDNDLTYRKDISDNKEINNPVVSNADQRKSLIDYKYNKDPAIPRNFTTSSRVVPNCSIPNYNYTGEYSKYPYPVQDYSKIQNQISPLNQGGAKTQEQNYIPQQKYNCRQNQYQNDQTKLTKPSTPPNINNNVNPSVQNPYFGSQYIKNTAPEFQQKFQEPNDNSTLSTHRTQPLSIYDGHSKYQIYQQKIAMQRYALECHLEEFVRIPGHQSHPKYKECVLQYRELLKIQQSFGYQNNPTNQVPTSTSAATTVPPINLQFDQNGALINTNYPTNGFTRTQQHLVNTSHTQVTESNVSNSSIPKDQNIQQYQQLVANPTQNDTNISTIDNPESRTMYMIQKPSEQNQLEQSKENASPLSDSSSNDKTTEGTKFTKELNKPDIDVRQFLANWDESEEEENPNNNLPDVVLSNTTPILIVDYENVNIAEKVVSNIINSKDNNFYINETPTENENPVDSQICTVQSDYQEIVKSGSIIQCIRNSNDQIPTIHIVDNLDMPNESVIKVAKTMFYEDKSKTENQIKKTEDNVANENEDNTKTDCQVETSKPTPAEPNENLKKQTNYLIEESHNPDDISLPDLQTSECTPISTTLNTPTHSDTEESSEQTENLTISTNPIEIIHNSPMISFTHSPIRNEPYDNIDNGQNQFQDEPKNTKQDENPTTPVHEQTNVWTNDDSTANHCHNKSIDKISNGTCDCVCSNNCKKIDKIQSPELETAIDFSEQTSPLDVSMKNSKEVESPKHQYQSVITKLVEPRKDYPAPTNLIKSTKGDFQIQLTNVNLKIKDKDARTDTSNDTNDSKNEMDAIEIQINLSKSERSFKENSSTAHDTGQLHVSIHNGAKLSSNVIVIPNETTSSLDTSKPEDPLDCKCKNSDSSKVSIVYIEPDDKQAQKPSNERLKSKLNELIQRKITLKSNGPNKKKVSWLKQVEKNAGTTSTDQINDTNTQKKPEEIVGSPPDNKSQETSKESILNDFHGEHSSGYVNPIFNNANKINKFHQVPVYTTKDGKITYSPSPKFIYRTFVREAQKKKNLRHFSKYYNNLQYCKSLYNVQSRTTKKLYKNYSSESEPADNGIINPYLSKSTKKFKNKVVPPKETNNNKPTDPEVSKNLPQETNVDVNQDLLQSPSSKTSLDSNKAKKIQGPTTATDSNEQSKKLASDEPVTKIVPKLVIKTSESHDSYPKIPKMIIRNVKSRPGTPIIEEISDNHCDNDTKIPTMKIKIEDIIRSAPRVRIKSLDVSKLSNVVDAAANLLKKKRTHDEAKTSLKKFKKSDKEDTKLDKSLNSIKIPKVLIKRSSSNAEFKCEFLKDGKKQSVRSAKWQPEVKLERSQVLDRMAKFIDKDNPSRLGLSRSSSTSDLLKTPQKQRRLSDYACDMNNKGNLEKSDCKKTFHFKKQMLLDTLLGYSSNENSQISQCSNGEVEAIGTTALIKVESSDDSQSTIELLPASPGIDQNDMKMEHIDGETLYSEDAIPTQFELELDIADQNSIDSVMASPNFSYKNLDTSNDRISRELFANDSVQREPLSFKRFNSIIDNNPCNLPNEQRVRVTKSDVKQFVSNEDSICCNEILVKDILAAKETLKKYLPLTRDDEFFLDAKQGSSFNLNIYKNRRKKLYSKNADKVDAESNSTREERHSLMNSKNLATISLKEYKRLGQFTAVEQRSENQCNKKSNMKIERYPNVADNEKDDKKEMRLKEDPMPVLEPQVALNFDPHSDRDSSRSPPVITNQDGIAVHHLDHDKAMKRDSEMTLSDIITQLAYHEKATIRHKRYCALCEKWFPSTARHHRHLTGYQHRHTELTQRRTIHALFMLFTGKPCAKLPPANVRRNDCAPGELTPLQIAVQDVAMCLKYSEEEYINKTKVNK